MAVDFEAEFRKLSIDDLRGVLTAIHRVLGEKAKEELQQVEKQEREVEERKQQLLKLVSGGQRDLDIVTGSKFRNPVTGKIYVKKPKGPLAKWLREAIAKGVDIEKYRVK